MGCAASDPIESGSAERTDDKAELNVADSDSGKVHAVMAVPPIIESDESTPDCDGSTAVLTLCSLMSQLDGLLGNGADYKEPRIFDAVQRLMESYDPAACLAWKEHCYADDDGAATYSRNLICSGRGYNLMILVWAKRSESVIHDHGGSECWLRVLEGALTEHFYECPQPGKPLVKVRTISHRSPGVCFINDDRGLHSIENESESVRAVSLHCYVPGYDKCNAYLDEQCADSRVECAMTKDSYCSIGGVKMEKSKDSTKQCRNACSKVRKTCPKMTDETETEAKPCV